MWDMSRLKRVVGDVEHSIVATFLYEDKANQLVLVKQRSEGPSQQHLVKSSVLAKKDGEKRQSMPQQAVTQHSQHSQGERVESLVALLHAAIQTEQRYPLAAEQMQREGKVVLAFILYTDGHISDLQILRSSGTHSLDEAALTAVRKAVPFQRVDEYLSQSQRYTIDVIFQLS